MWERHPFKIPLQYSFSQTISWTFSHLDFYLNCTTTDKDVQYFVNWRPPWEVCSTHWNRLMGSQLYETISYSRCYSISSTNKVSWGSSLTPIYRNRTIELTCTGDHYQELANRNIKRFKCSLAEQKKTSGVTAGKVFLASWLRLSLKTLISGQY